MPTIPPNNTSGLYGIDANAVPVGGNVDANNINATGNVTVGGYIIANGSITTNSNFVGDLVGNVTGNITLAGSNTQVIYNNNGVTGGSDAFTFNSDTNVVAVTGNVSATGNITGSYFLGNGSQLTGLPATYSNAEVAAYLASGSDTSNIITTANISGSYILGNGSQLTGLPQQYGNANVADYLASGADTLDIITTGTVQGADVTATDLVSGARFQTTGAAGNITGANYVSANFFVGDGSLLTNVASSYGNANVSNYLASGTDTANIVTTGNISGQYILGNGAFLTGVAASYGNSNVTTLLANLGSNTIVTTGNITGGNFIGSGATLTNLPAANIVGTVANAAYATNAGHATVADSANAVAGGNVTGQVANALVAGTVYTAAQPNITSVGTLSSLAVTGNVSGGNLEIGNNAHITNNLTVDGTIYGTFAGNITGNLVVPGSNTQVIYNNNGNAGASANFTFDSATNTVDVNGTMNADIITSTGNISAVGNIAGNYILGNGAFLTGVAASYGNANVAAYLPTYAGNIGGVLDITAGGTGVGNIQTSADYIGVFANSIQVEANGGDLQLWCDTGNIQLQTFSGGNVSVAANINQTSGNITTTGIVSATGNITGGNIKSGAVTYTPTDGTAGQVLTTYGNGKTYFSTVSGGSYGNTEVSNYLASGTDTANIITTGNVSGSYIIGNGSALTSITGANVTGTVANATYATSAGSATTATTAGTVTGNAQANITSVGTLTSLDVTGNITGGNVIATGTLKSGAVTITGTDGTAGQVLTTYGNGQTYFSTVSGGGSPGGSDTQIQFNDSSSFAGNANMTFNKTTGNIGFGNLVIGNTGTSGTYYNVITSKNTFLGNTATQPSNARILMGSGKAGDWSTTTDYNSNMRNARFVVADEYVKSDNGVRIAEIVGTGYANLNGSTTYGSANINSRIQAVTGDLFIMNGNIAISSGGGAPTIARAIAGAINAGTGANANMSNVSHGAGVTGSTTVNTGSSMGNAYSFCAFASGSGVMNTQIGYGIQLSGNANTSGNVFGVYNPGSTPTYGVSNGTTARGAANYYFLRNDDPLAKNQVGQLNRYFDGLANCGGSSGGAVTINANNGQFQYLNVTENVTSMSFSNFLSYTLNTSSTAVPLADTVTLVITQDATGRTITMPTSSGANIYKYAGGGNTISTTANSVTMVSITGVLDAVGNNLYLITISPEFS